MNVRVSPDAAMTERNLPFELTRWCYRAAAHSAPFTAISRDDYVSVLVTHQAHTLQTKAATVRLALLVGRRLAQRPHDSLPERPSLRHPIVPPLQVGQFGMLDVQRVPSMDGCSCRNISHRKVVSSKESPVRKALIKNSRSSQR